MGNTSNLKIIDENTVTSSARESIGDYLINVREYVQDGFNILNSENYEDIEWALSESPTDMGECFEDGIDGIRDRLKEDGLKTNREMIVASMIHSYAAYNVDTIIDDYVFVEHEDDVDALDITRMLNEILSRARAINVVWDKEKHTDVDVDELTDTFGNEMYWLKDRQAFERFISAGSIKTWKKRFLKVALVEIDWRLSLTIRKVARD